VALKARALFTGRKEGKEMKPEDKQLIADSSDLLSDLLKGE